MEPPNTRTTRNQPECHHRASNIEHRISNVQRPRPVGEGADWGARGGARYPPSIVPRRLRRRRRDRSGCRAVRRRSEEHTSELQSLAYLVCRLLLEKKKDT